MQHILALDPAKADGAVRELFDAVKQQLGAVPNIFRTVGQSPATLKGLLQFMTALSGGEISARLREQIALACAGANHCDYCAAAHTALGKRLGVEDAELSRNLTGEAEQPQAAAILRFVRKVVRERARIDAAELHLLREAGLSDGQIVEVIGNIALNLFTNYFNHIADTDVDFPAVRLPLAQAA